MKKECSNTDGFSVVELVIAVSIFSLIVTAFVGALLYFNKSAALAGSRARAVFLAEEGLETARNMRDEDFTALTDGTVEDTVDIFTRQVEVSTVDATTKEVTANVNWGQTSVSLVTYLTDWRTVSAPQADSLVVDTTNAATSGRGNVELQGITLENIGAVDIVIDKITVSWVKPGLRISEITIGGTAVWSKNGPGSPSGNQASGTEIDIEDVVLAAGSGVVDIDSFEFNNTISGVTFDVVFTLTDGSQKTVTNVTP